MGSIGRVGIVGAGLAGLAAARTLVAAGRDVVVFDKEAVPGGRLTSLSLGEFTFDPGATSIAPFDAALGRVIQNELDTTDLVVIDKPVYLHDGFRTSPRGVTASSVKRLVYSHGIRRLPSLLSSGLDLRLGCRIDSFESHSDDSYSLEGESFDAIVIAIPSPIAMDLLFKSGDPRRLSNVRFRTCLSLCLGFETPLEPPYHALVGPDQTHPLSWLSVESAKCPGRAPDGQTALVAQMSAEYSLRRFDLDDDLIIEETLIDVSRLLGKGFSVPVVSKVVRFQYSHPETTATFESVNSPLSRVVIAGDGLMAGRTELAYETGTRAAHLLLDQS